MAQALQGRGRCDHGIKEVHAWMDGISAAGRKQNEISDS